MSASQTLALKESVKESLILTKFDHPDWDQKQLISTAYKQNKATKDDFEGWCPYTFLEQLDFVEDFSPQLLNLFPNSHTMPLSMQVIEKVNNLLDMITSSNPELSKSEVYLKAYTLALKGESFDLYENKSLDDFVDEEDQIDLDHIIFSDMLFDDAVPTIMTQISLEGRNTGDYRSTTFKKEMKPLNEAATAGARRSTNIAGVGYVKGKLVVAFQNGGVYAYDIGASSYHEMMASSSKGEWLWKYLRGTNLGPVWGAPQRTTPGGTIASIVPYVKLTGMLGGEKEQLSGAQKAAKSTTKLYTPNEWFDPTFKALMEKEKLSIIESIEKQFKFDVDNLFNEIGMGRKPKKPFTTPKERAEKKAQKQQDKYVSIAIREELSEIRSVAVKDVKSVDHVDKIISIILDKYKKKIFGFAENLPKKRGGITKKEADQGFELSKKEKAKAIKLFEKRKKEEELKLIEEVKDKLAEEVAKETAEEPDQFTDEELAEVNRFLDENFEMMGDDDEETADIEDERELISLASKVSEDVHSSVNSLIAKELEKQKVEDKAKKEFSKEVSTEANIIIDSIIKTFEDDAKVQSKLKKELAIQLKKSEEELEKIASSQSTDLIEDLIKNIEKGVVKQRKKATKNKIKQTKQEQLAISVSIDNTVNSIVDTIMADTKTVAIVNKDTKLTKPEEKVLEEKKSNFLSLVSIRAKWSVAKKTKKQRETRSRKEEKEEAKRRKEERSTKKDAIALLKKKLKKLRLNIRRARKGNLPKSIVKGMQNIVVKLIKQIQNMVGKADFLQIHEIIYGSEFDDFKLMDGPITRKGKFPYGKSVLIKDWSNLKAVFAEIKHLPVFGEPYKLHKEVEVIGYAYDFTPNEDTKQIHASVYFFEDIENISPVQVDGETRFPVSIRYFETGRDSENVQTISDVIHLAVDPTATAKDRCSEMGGKACYIKKTKVAVAAHSDFMGKEEDKLDPKGGSSKGKSSKEVDAKALEDMADEIKSLKEANKSLKEENKTVKKVNTDLKEDFKVIRSDMDVIKAEREAARKAKIIAVKEDFLEEGATFTINSDFIKECEDFKQIAFLEKAVAKKKKIEAKEDFGDDSDFRFESVYDKLAKATEKTDFMSAARSEFGIPEGN